ncbi:MAG: glutamate synthase [Clostridiales bacterium]|nr:glutamate synthase [Clostridiales bacterium]
MEIVAGLRNYEELNSEINQTLSSKRKVVVKDLNGQRYIGCALDKGKTIEGYGTAGNDLACFLNGGKVVIYGNGQDAVGNTMSGGEIIIHGHSGDALGYGMRDGQIYIRDNVSCRGGIHMKEFRNMRPVLVIGQNAGSFLGEYMSGGTIVILGLNMKKGEKLFGSHCASGMQSGKMFVRGSFPKENLSDNITVQELDDKDKKELNEYVKKYCEYFGASFDEIMKKSFKKLVPKTSRPYANLYTAN